FVFFCFGFLLVAQYQTNVVLSGSLDNESQANLAMILKSVNDKKEQLQVEFDNLQGELTELQGLADSGISMSDSVRAKINTLQTAIGVSEVEGQGLTVTITGDSNLMYFDVIDIINELFVTGAEAVSINETRITNNTLISEMDNSRDGYNITVNGNPLLFPVVIKAIGDSVSLETGLTYPGGIMENLNTLYHVYPTIRLEKKLIIPAAKLETLRKAQAVAPEPI
ncbi:MAG: DUF881 domain-containing protein, partial [Clostridiales bacterium]